MESMKRAKDQLDGLINLAEFLKEVRGYVEKNKDLPGHIASQEKIRQSLVDEVNGLVKQRSEVTSDIKNERERQIGEIEAKEKELNDKIRLLDEERSKVKGETDRLQIKEKKLDESIASYESSLKSYEEKNKILDEKLKRVSEAVA